MFPFIAKDLLLGSKDLLVKLAPLAVLALLCLVFFMLGMQYKGYKVDKAVLKAQQEAQALYESKLKDYIATLEANQVEYENKVKELDNDTSVECNAIAPKCLVGSF